MQRCKSRSAAKWHAGWRRMMWCKDDPWGVEVASALQEEKEKRKDQRPLFPMLRRSRALGDFRGASAMQAIDAGRPLRGWMLQQRGAVVLQIPRQLHL